VELAMKLQANQALLAVALGILLIFASGAHLAGMASITGAYLAGLFLGRTRVRRRLLGGMDTIGHALFISIFFVHVGLEADVGAVGGQYLFLILYILAGILGKLAGCGLGARLSGLQSLRSVRVGIGMVPRGEVALAVTSMAMSRGLMESSQFSSTVLLVLVTTLITPPLLKWSFAARTDS
jgi:Kef-type K+ transport system membrane component KefB